MRKLVLLVALFGLVACSDTYMVDRPMQISKRLMPSATAYVSVPPDGSGANGVVPGSGAATTQIVANAFRRYLKGVTEATEPQTYAQALEKAKAMGAAYLIAPSIDLWSDNPDDAVMMPDQVKVVIAVVEVASGHIIERATVSSTSGLFDYAGPHPDAILAAVVKDYVNTLF